jgi:molecular chaperone DnaK (HSP70)
MPQEIVMSYKNLIDALNGAIDKEALETNNLFVTNERITAPEAATYDYDALMAEFQDIVGVLMSKGTTNAPKITAIVEKYLGKGKKVNDTTPEQAEFINLIVSDLKADLM